MSSDVEAPIERTRIPDCSSERVLVLGAVRLISVPDPGPCERVLVLGAGRLISVPDPGPCERVLVLGAAVLSRFLAQARVSGFWFSARPSYLGSWSRPLWAGFGSRRGPSYLGSWPRPMSAGFGSRRGPSYPCSCPRTIISVLKSVVWTHLLSSTVIRHCCHTTQDI